MEWSDSRHELSSFKNNSFDSPSRKLNKWQVAITASGFFCEFEHHKSFMHLHVIAQWVMQELGMADVLASSSV